MIKALVLLVTTSAIAAGQVYLGVGCTTAFHIDRDCDGYGVGTAADDPHPLSGPDADDGDAVVHDADQARAAYPGGSSASDGLSGFLAHLGYTPTNYYYLSPSGSNTTGAANDPALPYATVAGLRTAHALVAGDIVLVRGGTFMDNWNLVYPNTSGAEGNPVIIMAYPGERPLWDSASNIAGGDVDLGNHDVVLDGLNFTNTAANNGRTYFFGADVGNLAQRITIRNSEVYARSNGAFMMQGLTDILIERNVFRDQGDSHNIYLGARDNPGANVTVRGNVLYRPVLTCAQYNGRVSNYVLEGNICHSFYGASGFSLEMGVHDSFVRNNLVFNGGRQPAVVYNYPEAIAFEIFAYSQYGNVIENNTFVVGRYDYRNGSAWPSQYSALAIAFGASYDDELVLDIGTNTFRNNLLVTSGTSELVLVSSSSCTYPCAVSGSCTGADYCVHGAQSPEGIASRGTWAGNLMYGSASAMRVTNVVTLRNATAYPGGDVPMSVNNTYDAAAFAAYGPLITGTVFSNPAFVHNVDTEAETPGVFDFRLTEDSPAIGSGTSDGLPATDIRGIARTSADIGAYAFASSAKISGRFTGTVR